MADFKRKDVKRHALELVDMIEVLRIDMARQDGLIQQQAATIVALRTLVADLLEWADHQADCLIHDDDICDCGYDALAQQWEQLRD